MKIKLGTEPSLYGKEIGLTPLECAEESPVSAYSELQHLTEKLRDCTERFELATRGNADGIWDWNVVTNEIFYAPRYTELLGYADNELAGTLEAWKCRVHPDDLTRVMQNLDAHTIDRIPYDVEYRILHSSGEFRWHRARGQAIWDESGKAVRMVGSSSDITDRRLAESRVLQFAEELQRSNQDLEQFAYVASHDLQEPLRKVASCCQILAEDYGDKLDDKGKEWIKFAVDGAKRMSFLITDLLAYSRIGSQKNANVNVNTQDIYDETTETLATVIKEANAQLICHPLPTVLANQTQLLHLFQNLIGNAIKYRSDIDPIIEIGAEPIRIQHENRDSQEMWQFYIRDNGIGIAPDYFEKIFVIFQRLHTREKYEGTGIGLALCKKIVARLGGKIWVESKAGQGSTFHFTLPAVEKCSPELNRNSRNNEKLDCVAD